MILHPGCRASTPNNPTAYIPRKAYTVDPKPIRTISRLGGILGVILAVIELFIGGPADIVISWCMLGFTALVILAWAVIRKYGTDEDREEFPVGRQLVRQMRDDLRPVKLWLGRTWQNIGGW